MKEDDNLEIKIRNGNKQLMRDINKSKILNLVKSSGEISRIQIAKQLGLSQATVTYITEELISNGFLLEKGEQKSTGGRKPKVLNINENYGVIASVGISKHTIEVVICNVSNQVLSRSLITEKVIDPEKAKKIISETIKGWLSAHDNPKLLGISVISSGLVNRNKGIILKSTLLNWQNVPIVQMLKEDFPNIKILLDKDINAVALYEMNMGKAKSLKDFLIISIGEGLGMSTVIRNHIYYGDFGGAGEFGHITFQKDGYQCHCGQKGCLEQYASEFYLKNKLNDLEIEKYDSDHLLKSVGQAALTGDEQAIALLKQMGSNLGIGLKNLINVLNPKGIIIVGAAVKYKHFFMDEVYKAADTNFFSNADLKTKIITSEISNDAWYQGASMLITNGLFEIPIYQEVNGFGGAE